MESGGLCVGDAAISVSSQSNKSVAGRVPNARDDAQDGSRGSWAGIAYQYIGQVPTNPTGSQAGGWWHDGQKSAEIAFSYRHINSCGEASYHKDLGLGGQDRRLARAKNC